MFKEFSIPEMTTEDIVNWYQKIKPIVCHNGDLRYMRELSPDELIHKSYTWLNKPEDYGDKVDLSTLSILTDVKMLHKYSYYSYFKPSVGEIIRQIPEELRTLTDAFEIIYSPSGQPDFNIFKDEFDQNYHVSIVRLYQKSDKGYSKAEKLLEYPTSGSPLPVYMEAEKFKKLISK